MRVLVTGGNGYLGRRLVPLLARTSEVHLLDRAPPSSPPAPGVSFMKGDIRDKSLDISGFGAVFHLAALSLPGDVEGRRDEAWDVNVNGTLNICQKLGKGARVVFMSSAHVYDRKTESAHKEDELPAPANFYGLTKLVGEEVVKFHARRGGFSYAILRLFNSYSADQPRGLLIGDVMEKYRRPGRVEISNPRAEIDLVHADDAVSVIAAAAGFGEGTYNICTGRTVAVREVYERVKRYVGAGERDMAVVSDNPYRIAGDNSRLKGMGFKFREFSL